MSGCIVGWAHSKFGKHEGRDIESLIVEVTHAALADAGVSAADIDTVYLGTMNGGFVCQEFPASLVFQADPGFRFKPATPASANAACVTSTISDSMSLPSCLPNLLCAQPTMHPLMPPSRMPRADDSNPARAALS